MEIDGDTGRHGDMLIFTDLGNAPYIAAAEILDAFGDADLTHQLNLDYAQSFDEIQQIRRLSVSIDVANVQAPDVLINKLSRSIIGENEGSFRGVNYKVYGIHELDYWNRPDPDEEADPDDHGNESEARYEVRIEVERI